MKKLMSRKDTSFNVTISKVKESDKRIVNMSRDVYGKPSID